MKNSFKNNLVKGIVVSSLVLGVGVTAILSPIAANAATITASKEKDSGNEYSAYYDQTIALDDTYSIGFKHTSETGFFWAAFENTDPNSAVANGSGTIGTEFTFTITNGEDAFPFTVTLTEEEKEVGQYIGDFTLLFGGAEFSENNFPLINLGSTFNPLDKITFVNADGEAFLGTITADVSSLDTTKLGIYPVQYTVNETREASAGKSTKATTTELQTASFTVPVAVVNEIFQTYKEETTLTIDSAKNNVDNKASYTAKDGTLRFDVWNTGGTNYTLNVVDLLTEGQPVVKEFNFSSNTTIGYVLDVTYEDIFKQLDQYTINFAFTTSTGGTDVGTGSVAANTGNTVAPTVIAPVAKSPVAKANKPTKLAQTNAGLGMLPAVGGLTAVGGSIGAIFKSRRKK
ncbi:cell wall protein [Carnobacterium maltaromaticum]|uniref:cell wall protein n=1 Tax=Carnobacterium maltaromaticum TaxID=2751 RepID=UPI0039B0F431